MAQCFKTTLTAQYLDKPNTREMRQVMEVFCNETVRLINWELKKQAPDVRDFESQVTYGWFQIPEEPGLYAIQVIGPHEHDHVVTIGEGLQKTADQGGYPVVINVLKV
jgi:hypothetical protein